MMPAMIKGQASPNPTVRAAIPGPNTKPKLSEAPTIPKALARSSIDVESEMTAKATGIFPAVSPSKARAINKNRTLGAKAMTKNESAVPNNDKSNIGLRPYLSDKRPIIGVEKNWQTEYKAKRRPLAKS